MPNVAPERRRATMTVCWHRCLRTGTVHAIDPGDCGVFVNHRKRLRSTQVRRIVMHDDVQLLQNAIAQKSVGHIVSHKSHTYLGELKSDWMRV